MSAVSPAPIASTVRCLDQAPVLDVGCHGATIVGYAPELLAPLASLPEPSGFGPGTLPPGDDDPDLATLVAVDGRVVACAMGRLDGDTAYVSLLYVHPDFRRRRALAAFALKRFLAKRTARERSLPSYDAPNSLHVIM